MLRSGKVVVGSYYIDSKRSIARRVLKIANGTITFNTYHLDNGNSTGYPSLCLKTDFIHWADHETTQTEISSLHKYELDAH